MSDTLLTYTAPMFGRVDLKGYSFKGYDFTHILQIRNNAAQQRKNQYGQVTKAGVYCNHTFHNPSNSTGSKMSCQANNYAYSITVDYGNNPIAILAIPRRYGSGADTGNNGEKNWWTQVMIASMAALPDSENLTYDYYLCYQPSYQSYTLPNTIQTGKYVYQVDAEFYNYSVNKTTLEITSVETFPTQAPTYNTPTFNESAFLPYAAYTGFIKNLVANMEGLVNQRLYSNRRNVYDVPYYTDATKNILNDAIQATEESDDAPLLTSVYAAPLRTECYRIGAFIATGMPVFTIDNFDQLINYFAKRPYESENDIVFPPSDWSTDWDIYIKGAQKPDIFITMKSDKVDSWLDDIAENTEGISKEDIKVEYRYNIHGSVGDNDIDSGATKEWLKDIYNVTRATSYMEGISLNYPSDVLNGGSEFSDYVINELMDIYAELEFRISYWRYKSTWCKYKIGVIGSPSIPDFTKMQNEGKQVDTWSDSSTVTLHYDDYPPGYNPYPTPPEPPGDKPNPTSPTAGINGTGLLTTTYQITEDNARALGRFLWGGDLFQKIKALNFSPIENIVSLTYMPINIGGNTSVIVIGDVDTNINGDVIGNTTPLYNLGSVMVNGRYNSFLDFAPYTSAHIFLPFVGFVPLDPQVFTGKTLGVIYSYDLIGGVCNAMLFANGIYIESHQGNCGIDVPLVASNRAEVMLGIVTSLANNVLSPTNLKSNMALDVLNMGTDVVNAAQSFHPSRQGSYSPACAWSETRECFIVLETPNAWMADSYAHDYGRPCLSSYNIGQLSGFTVCDQTVDISGIGGATEEEKQKIREILTSGFYA